jgi:Zn-dependent protease/CBS domain-containing protein
MQVRARDRRSDSLRTVRNETDRKYGRMTATIRLGRWAGVEIGVHWSWALIFGLLVWALASTVFPELAPGLSGWVYVLLAFLAALAFFGSLLLHEMGHARQAHGEGMGIDGITLWIFGGVARFRGSFPSPGAEFRIAVAGPLVTLLIAAISLLGAWLLPLGDALGAVLFWLGYVNLALLVFNLMPAFPLDGGRVLRSALWARSGDFLAATTRAASIGRLFGQFLIAVGIVSAVAGGAIGGLWLAFIGWFILWAAEAERAGAEAHSALEGVTVGDLMTPDPVTVDVSMTVADFVDHVFLRHRFVAYPVTRDGRAAGIVSFRSAVASPRETWSDRPIQDAMVPISEATVLRSDTSLEDALAALGESDIRRGLVLDGEHLVGMLSATDATRALEALTRRASG